MKETKRIIEAVAGVTKVEPRAGTRFYVEVEPNEEGEKFALELSLIYPDNSSRNSLPNLWHKHGHTEKVLESYIYLETFYTTENRSYSRFNPTIKTGHELNFDYVYEVSEENIIKLLEETIKRYKNNYKEKEGQRTMKKERLEALRKEYGTVETEEKTYYLTQVPYLDGITTEEVVFVALAVDENEEEYMIEWEPFDEWKEEKKKAEEANDANYQAPNILTDDSLATDWEEPARIEKL